MKKLLGLVFLFQSLFSFSQNNHPQSLGIGFAVLENPYVFEMGSHPQVFFSDKSLSKKIGVPDQGVVYPLFYKPDYGLYHLICLEKTDTYYKVLANDTLVAYIPTNTLFVFKTWNEIVLNHSLERLSKSNPIYQYCSTGSKQISNPCETERLVVKELLYKDNLFWARISFSTSCEADPEENNPNQKSGWVIWRNQNKLLVNILLLC